MHSDRIIWFNSLTAGDAAERLTDCCGSRRWVSMMLERRPFKDEAAVLTAAEEIWNQLAPDDWKEAFSHHPKIGDWESLKEKFAATRSWAEGEQSGVREAPEELLKHLAAGNVAYEQTFGYIFIVCATGKSADELLDVLRERLKNSPEAELSVAAAEQLKITHLRLRKLLT